MILFGCTEPYVLQTSNFEEALVIEATLTNEFKKQQIKLSKTYRLEENGPVFVENADVTVEDDLGNVYNFVEGDEIYESENEFEAVVGRKYNLKIVANGKVYTSTPENLTQINPINTVEVNDRTIDNVRGAEIKVKAFDPTNSSKYYRYEFEETYKIVAPQWRPYTVTINPTTTELIFSPRTYEAKTCYSTVKSNELLLHSTSNLSEDRVDHTVRFIPINNPIITHRYSILVKQYVQNLESYTYYKTLKTISGTDGILSQNQPGFFSGNITCLTNPNEKVVGFFDVSSVSLQRIFFNFEDLFPGTPKPDYFYDCWDDCIPEEPNCPRFRYCFDISPSTPCKGYIVMNSLNSTPQTFLYVSGPDPMYLVEPPCGDCTTFSSNIIPPFWY